MRHVWKGAEPLRTAHKSERECQRPGCRTIKVTRHENTRHWVEWYRAENEGDVPERIVTENDKAPPCRGAELSGET